MAFEDKVNTLEVELWQLKQQIQTITVQLKDWKLGKLSEEESDTTFEESVLAESDDNSFSVWSEDQTRPLRSENILVDPKKYSLSIEEYQDLVLDTLDDDIDLIDEIRDSMPLELSNDAFVSLGNSGRLVSNGANGINHEFVANVPAVEEQSSDLFDTWNDLNFEEWIDESYPQTDSCYRQFCFLFHWIEETVEYIGQEKMRRTLHLYNRHGYIPDKVYILLRDVIQLMPESYHKEGDTHRIINSLMELNGILGGNIRIGMNELMEIVGQN